ncbi:Ig-like domain-containing protein [Thetidibacter halocola]|uniref:Tandem-95 repeat protein n=1 Tax=Thetidibacter halocola TaxID=2827239 RepID=A0A8J7WKK6_9RHOB|nr:Ig-like domain-containing protein [Thetidibacter halocola]MBS0126729.1 tandem-95 repeat protein [Thetidibacter halocola]
MPNESPILLTDTFSFEKFVVDNTMTATHAVAAADFDGDGDIDLVSTAEDDNTVAWFRNDGGLGFTKIVIDASFLQAYPVSVADMNGDGFIDVLAGGYGQDEYRIYVNDGVGNFSLGATLVADGAHSIFGIDMDSDGDMDVVVADQDGNRIAWYQNDGALNFAAFAVDASLKWAKTAVPADVNGDGFVDIIGTWNRGSFVRLYLNDGEQNFTAQTVDATIDGAYFAVAADLDGDGDVDIVSVGHKDNTLAWYQNDGNQTFTKIAIDTAVAGARSVVARDVDLDGDIDLLATARLGDAINLYLNDGTGTFTGSALDATAPGAYGVDTFDVNLDGLPDVIAALRDSGEVVVYFQTRGQSAQVTQGSSVVIDNTRLQAVDVDDDPSSLIYTLDTLPTSGELRLGGGLLGAGGNFTQADVDAGLLTYVHDGTSGTNDTFAFTLADGGEDGAQSISSSFFLAINTGELDAVPDAFTTNFGEMLFIDIPADLLANDIAGGGQTPGFDGFTLPSNGSLIRSGDTLTYTPNPGFDGIDGFTYTVSDGGLSDTASVSITVLGAPAELVSDDFSDPALSGIWTQAGPAGTSVALGVEGDDKFVRLSTPAGNYDAFNQNNAARLLQAVADTDFEVEARFLSVPVDGNEFQGILVEQDANTWMRFDTYSNGTNLIAFAAVTVNGSSSIAINNVTIPGGEAPYLRVTRVGDAFTFAYSTDGVSYVTAGTVTRAIEVNAIGPFAGSTSGAGGFDAKVDYFFNTASPIVPEDDVGSPGNQPPVAVDDAFSTGPGVPLAGDVLANDSDPEGDPLTAAVLSGPVNGTLSLNPDGTFDYTPNPGFDGSDGFTYTVSDGSATDEGAVAITVLAALTDPVSDDFSDPALSGIWTQAGPAGTSVALGVEGDEKFVRLSTPAGNYDAFNQNNAARLLQAVADTDFEVEARFLSVPVDGNEFQGILVEQDANTWMRFDTYSNGTNLIAFAAVTVNGSSSIAINNVTIPGGEAPYLRVTRVGDEFTFAYSTDGVSYVTAGTVTRAIEVNAIGPFAGSTNGAGGFDAKVDYFFNTASPIVPEDPVSTLPQPVFDLPGARSFDGSAAAVLELPHDAIYALAEGTIAFAFTAADTNGAQGLFTKDASGFAGGGNHFALYLDGTVLTARFQDGAASETVKVNGIEANREYEVAVTFDAGGGTVWLDGVAVATSALVMDWSGGGNVEYIQWGGRGWGSQTGQPGFDAPFEGTISDMQVYDTALDATQIAELAGGGVNQPPVAVDDAFSTGPGVPLAGDVLANDSDPEGDPLTAAVLSGPVNGTLSLNPDGTFDYTPNPGFDGSDGFTYTVSDGSATDEGAVAITVLAALTDPVSDDFSDPALSGIWTQAGPAGTSVALGVEGDEKFVRLSTPAGNYDAFNQNNAARLLQAVADTDFEVEARFLSVPVDGNEFQGILVEQDANTWMRFDTYSNGTNLIAFAAVTVNGSSSIAINNVTIPGGEAPYLRVTRVGDEFTFAYSTDGVSYVTAGTVTRAIEVNAIGPFAGSTNGAGGFDAKVDYFFNTASPIVPEDPVSTLPQPVFDLPGARSFDGSAAAVLELPHDAIYALAEGTIAFAFTAADTNGAQGLFTKDASGFAGGGNHFALYLDGTVLTARFQDGAASETVKVNGIEANREYEVAVTFDAGGGTVWLDGVAVATSALVMDWSGGGNVEYIQWGGRGWGSQTGQPGFDAPFEGTISDMQVYDTALDATQIAELAVQPAGGNAPPVPDDETLVTSEDTPAAITVSEILDGDTDPDGDTLSFEGLASQPQNGTAVYDATAGTVTYTPGPDYFGFDSFGVLIGDGAGGFAQSLVAVTVDPVEDDPVANDDLASMQAGGTATINVLGNDVDVDGDTLVIQSFDAASANGGSVTGNGDGMLTYTPPVGFLGEDTFTYVVSDGAGPTDTATVTVTVSKEPVLPVPVFVQGGVTTYSGASADVDNYAPGDLPLAIAEGTIAFSFIDGDPGIRQGLVVRDASSFVGGGNHFAAYVDRGDLKLRFQDGADDVTFVFADLNPNEEYEVAATFSASGVALYVNGALIDSDPLVMNWETNVEWLQVGGLGWGSATGSSAFSNPFSGQIADVEIYDEMLSDAFIADLAAVSSFDIA